MLQIVIRTLLTSALIVAVAEVGKRSPVMAALVASLPLVSVLGMCWLYHDTRDIERLASHSLATLWYVLPSLPMFVLMPVLWRLGINFWLGLALGCLLTVALYALTTWALAYFQMR